MKIKTELSHRGKRRSIIFRISVGFYVVEDGKKKYKPIRYFTGETIEFDYWDEKRERPKSDNKLDERLTKGRSEVRAIYNQLVDESKLNFETFKEALNTSEALNLIFNKEREINHEL